MINTLLPCPFCGGVPTIEDVHISDPIEAQHMECVSVGCEACDYTLMTGSWGLGWYTSKEKAITAWNRRGAPPPRIGALTDQKQPDSRASTRLGGGAQACPEGAYMPTSALEKINMEVLTPTEARSVLLQNQQQIIPEIIPGTPEAQDPVAWLYQDDCDLQKPGSGTCLISFIRLEGKSNERPLVFADAPPSASLQAGGQDVDKADAARYRFLRDVAELSVRDVFSSWSERINDGLDVAIDAARAQQDGHL